MKQKQLELELMLERAAISLKEEETTLEEVSRRYSQFSPKLSEEEAKLDDTNIISSKEVTDNQFLTFSISFPEESEIYLSFLRQHVDIYVTYLVLVLFLYRSDNKNLKESISALLNIAHTDTKVKIRHNQMPDTSDLFPVSDAMIEKHNTTNSINHRLKEQNDYWKKLFENFPAGIMLVDQKDQVLDFNPSIFLSLKLPSVPRKSDSLTFQELIPLNSINTFYEEAKTQNNKIYKKEVHCQRNNTVEVFKATAISLFNNKNVRTGTLLVFEDITTLKRLEDMRKEFASNVSHELKTPITIIRGYIETIQSALEDAPQLALKFINKVEKNAERMTNIIEDLSVLSKIEQDNTWVTKGFEEKDVNDTIKSALALCQSEVDARQVQLKVLLENSAYYKATELKANHRLLEQALRNLIENAIRYSPEGATVTITSRSTPDELKISIADNGPGISSKDQSKIFERFYRVDKSRDRSTGGSGLGLAIVKHIVRVHNGRIELNSTIGEGSTFTIYIKR